MVTMKRPLVWALACLVAGIFLGRSADGAALGIGVVTLFAGVCAGIWLCLRKRVLLPMVLLAAVFAAAGYLLAYNAAAEKAAVCAKTGEAMTLHGRINNVKVSAKGSVSGVLRTSIDGEEVRVLVRFPEGTLVEEGQDFVVLGELMMLETARNPGGFDEWLYHRARGVDAKMYADVMKAGGVHWGIRPMLFAVRGRMTEVFYEVLPERDAGVLNAMITGDTAGIDEEVGEMYRAAGIYHIIAVSGTHMTILAAAISAILSRLGLSRRTAGLFALGVVALYCLFTGASASAVRAVVMFGVIALAPVVRRDADAVSATSFAAIVLLLYSPLYLWDVGFLYSFAAVFALVVGTGAVERALKKLLGFGHVPLIVVKVFAVDGFRRAVCAAVAVFLATWPITAWFFYSVSPISLLANIVILPTVTLLTISGFLAGVLGMIWPPLGVFAAGAAHVILRAYEWICRAVLAVPYANVLTGRPPLWLLAIYAVVLVLAALSMSAYGAAHRRRRWMRWAAGGLCAAGVLMMLVMPKPLRVTMLDVGQGDALVLSRGGQAVIWDGGGQAQKELGDNTGRWVVLPYLRYMGKARVDAVLTHADADHALGIVEAMDEGVVRRLFLPIGMDREDSASEEGGIARLVFETAEANGVEIVFVRAGDRLALIDGVSMLCLHPSSDEGSASGNDGSIVCRVEYGGVSFLLTGDVESESEAQMLAAYGAGGLLDVDVLKVAHHGSKTSSTEAFLKAASPVFAVAGAGRNSRYGHPSSEVVERLDALDVPLATTAERGAVLFETDGRRMTVQYMVNEER